MAEYRSSRMIGNGISLAVHFANIAHSLYTLRGDVLKDKKVYNMQVQQYIYFTIWNIIFQLAYLIATIICEVQEMYKINDRGLLKPVKALKQVFFDSVVFPSTFAVIVLFWPPFIYDRELLFPAFIDEAIGALPNYIMHAFILPVVLWEMRFMPVKRGSTIRNLANTTIVFICYLIVLFYNYNKRSLWPYPLVYTLYGTIYFPLALMFALSSSYVGYFAQWPLRRLLCINYENKKKKL